MDARASSACASASRHRLSSISASEFPLANHLEDPFLHGDQGFRAIAVFDINTGSIPLTLLWRETRMREVIRVNETVKEGSIFTADVELLAMT
jgi:hypothetical protein